MQATVLKMLAWIVVVAGVLVGPLAAGAQSAVSTGSASLVEIFTGDVMVEGNYAAYLAAARSKCRQVALQKGVENPERVLRLQVQKQGSFERLVDPERVGAAIFEMGWMPRRVWLGDSVRLDRSLAMPVACYVPSSSLQSMNGY